MKVYYRPHSKLTIELEPGDQKELVDMLAQVQEIIVHECGKCGTGGEGLQYQVRTVDDNKFYELRCTKCGAVLSFGSHKKGNSLFPKRYAENEDGEREWLPSNGWTKWDKEQQKRV